jgi:hypothetical protein
MGKMPPVPPDQQSANDASHSDSSQDKKGKKGPVPDNLREQDRQGNIYQNTHNQGYQQDR